MRPVTAIAVAATAAAFKAAARLFDTVEDVVVVFRCAAQFPRFDHTMHFIVGYECTMHPNRQARTGRHVQHIAHAQKRLGAEKGFFFEENEARVAPHELIGSARILSKPSLDARPGGIFGEVLIE